MLLGRIFILNPNPFTTDTKPVIYSLLFSLPLSTFSTPKKNHLAGQNIHPSAFLRDLLDRLLLLLTIITTTRVSYFILLLSRGGGGKRGWVGIFIFPGGSREGRT